MAEKTNKTAKKQLGIPELTGYGIGNCIGSGIFVSMGAGIAYTGHSITLALAIACIVVLFAYAYHTIMAGMFVLPGGKYSQAAILQPPILVGFTAISTIFTGLAFAMYGISIVEYASAVFPSIVEYKEIIAASIITLFFLTTFLGGKFMGKFNLVLVAVLMVSLFVYLVVGLPRVDYSSVLPTSENYFYGGAKGFIMAIAMMSFACQGATMPIAMTKDTKDPKRKLPIAIILASVIVAVIYALIGIVSSGVLPVEEVANKSLGVVAKEIFPYPVFAVFIIGGACFAIATSLYGAIAAIQHPMMATIEDGWLPAFLGKKTKNGYPWVMMLVLYIIAIVPIFVKMELNEMISIMMIPVMVLNLVNNILMFRLVKKYPDPWKKSFFHMPRWAFTIVMIIAILCDFLISAALFTTLKSGDQYALIIAIAVLFAYSFYRIKAKKVNLQALDEAKAEAEAAIFEESSEAVQRKKLKMIIFPKLKEIPPLPDGYKIRNYRDENDILPWVNVCKNGLYSDDAGAEAFAKDITNIPGIDPFTDLFIIEDADGNIAATVTAVDNFNNTGLGNIHMVSVATKERGKGLGHILCAIAERKLYNNGVKMATLVTDDWRKAACKSYLKAGFYPVNYDEDMVMRWSALLKEFNLESVSMLKENGEPDITITADL